MPVGLAGRVFCLGEAISRFTPAGLAALVDFLLLNRDLMPTRLGEGADLRLPPDEVMGETNISPGPLGVSGMSEYSEYGVLADDGVLGDLFGVLFGDSNRSVNPDNDIFESSAIF